MGELTASAHLHGHGVRVGFSWHGGSQRPPLRVVRRRKAWPATANDGLVLVDLGRLFATPSRPWGLVEHTRYLLLNSTAEGGLLQAELVLFFQTAGDPTPERVELSVFNGSTLQSFTFTGLLGLTRSEEKPAEDRSDTLLHLQVDGSPVGTVRIASWNTGAKRFSWERPAQPILSADFELAETRSITSTSTRHSDTSERLLVTYTTTRGGVASQKLTVEDTYDPNADRWGLTLALEDGEPSRPGPSGLEPGTWYYYAAFVAESSPMTTFTTRPEWRAEVLVTGAQGMSERLYGLLPAVHRQHDEPDPSAEQAGQGQLRRFLQVFGAALDQARGLGESLTRRHDPHQVGTRQLAALARSIGWESAPGSSEHRLRTELSQATEVFSTTGTFLHLRTLVARETGWKCEVRDFVRHVLVTNGTPPDAWDLWWTLSSDGSDYTDTTTLEAPNPPGVDGRPAALTDVTKQVGVFWHSRRGGRRELWYRWATIRTFPAIRVMQDAPDDAPDFTATDENPAVVSDPQGLWLFWSSNRTGTWDVWGRKMTRLAANVPPTVAGMPERLTTHLTADDRNPAAVRTPDGRLWLFWQSNRRGPTDIWVRSLTKDVWDAPRRVTSGAPFDVMPVSVVGGDGKPRLLWCRDDGNRSRIYLSVLQSTGRGGEVWSPPEDISSAGTSGNFRDEAPTAVWWKNKLWVFWHSNRDNNAWTLWGRVQETNGWGPVFPMRVRFPGESTQRVLHESKEPVAVVQGEYLRLVWRSQWNHRMKRARTVNTLDKEGLARRGQPDEPIFYTYDAGTGPQDWYASGNVGIYVTPPAGSDHLKNLAQLERVKAWVERFRPLPARYFWILPSQAQAKVRVEVADK